MSLSELPVGVHGIEPAQHDAVGEQPVERQRAGPEQAGAQLGELAGDDLPREELVRGHEGADEVRLDPPLQEVGRRPQRRQRLVVRRRLGESLAVARLRPAAGDPRGQLGADAGRVP